jgi:uncharacterized membrane protein
MKSSTVTFVTAIALFLALAVPVQLAAQSNYSVAELGELGGTAGSANSIDDRGWVVGADNLAGDLTSVATLWVQGSAIPLGTLEQGPNSAVAWPVKNNNGVIVGISELADADPLGENFSCWPFFPAGVPTGRICKGFRWQNGQMTALPPFPGGYSSYATGVNNRGQVVGWAENGVPGPSCDPAFQVLQFRAAIWQPNGQMQELPPLPATAPVRPQQSMTTVRWSASPAIVALRYEAFVWTKAGGMKSLGKIPGDLRSTANGLNEKGDKIVGLSRGGPHLFRAILWENNKLIDMNSLTVPGSPFRAR